MRVFVTKPIASPDPECRAPDSHGRHSHVALVIAMRHLLRHHRHLAGLVLALALLLKVVVPSGFMVSSTTGSVAIVICDGHGPMTASATMADMHHRGEKQNHQGGDSPCAFSGLTAPVLSSTDPAILVIAIAFILIIAEHLVARPRPSTTPFLRPPLRGPPARS